MAAVPGSSFARERAFSLRNLDLNLLLSLEALLDERGVTRAAERMGVAQPTMSGALAKLRRHFGDELLVRESSGYQLTPLGRQLRERVRHAVSEVEHVFQSRSEFDPAACTREFKLMSSDYEVALVGARLADLLAIEAPRARLRISPVSSESTNLLESNLLTHDLLLTSHGVIDDMPCQNLFEDEWVCIVAADNPYVGAELTMAHLGTLSWAVSFHSPTTATPAMRQLRMLGVEPDVRIITDGFLTLPAAVRGSHRVAMVQKRMLGEVVSVDGLRVMPCPFPADPVVEAAWWHPVHTDNAEHAYLRAAAVRACALLD